MCMYSKNFADCTRLFIVSKRMIKFGFNIIVIAAPQLCQWILF